MAARRLQGEKDFLRSERLAGEKFEESQLEKVEKEIHKILKELIHKPISNQEIT